MKDELLRRLDELAAAAWQRREAEGADANGLYPTETDWMTDAELKEMHECQLQLREFEPTEAELRERVRRKRAARKALREGK